jgi:DNA polymerase-3 subunit epsilon
MREIVLDTETTGLDPLSGHRIVEVGCIELVNMVATGITYQCYFNPERDMPTGAQDIHGLTEEFLSDKPLFADKVEELLAFIGDSQLVIHNAQFDLGFLNAELERAGRAKIGNAYIDTVSMARRKFPGQRASLDALCERFGIDNTERTKPALLDRSCWRGLSRTERRRATSWAWRRDDRRGRRAGWRPTTCRCTAAPAPYAERHRRACGVPGQISDPLWLKA